MISLFLLFFSTIKILQYIPKTKLSNKISTILDKMHQKDVYQSYFTTYATSETGKNNNDPGFLHFYTQEISSKQMIIFESEPQKYTYGNKTTNTKMNLQNIQTNYMINISKTDRRPVENKTSTDFITIHDTGNDVKNADALAHAKYVTNGENVVVSWHFTVDEKSIYQHLPLSEKGKHAGDGSNFFKLFDSGIKYKNENPEMYFNESDKFLYINNEKSLLKIDNNDGYEITPDGLYYEKGNNGNYFINNFYYNTIYKKISNGGGNPNSIGIESCIQEGVIYSKVMRNLGSLITRLLDFFDLDPRRVMKHRNFSGKLCPQSMIRAKSGSMFEYNNLIELVKEYYYIVKNLPNAKFSYESKNPDLLDNEGFILKYVEVDTEVSYVVKVEVGDVVVEKEYKTIIHPKTE